MNILTDDVGGVALVKDLQFFENLVAYGRLHLQMHELPRKNHIALRVTHLEN